MLRGTVDSDAAKQAAEDIAKGLDGVKSVKNDETNAGIVSLTREVSDIMTSANASRTAWQVPGVKSVKNDITVKEKA
jgi:osmotically-inducible protein OsmY